MFRRACLGLLLALLAFGTPASAQERHPAPYGSVQPLDRILPGIRNGRPGGRRPGGWGVGGGRRR